MLWVHKYMDMHVMGCTNAWMHGQVEIICSSMDVYRTYGLVHGCVYVLVCSIYFVKRFDACKFQRLTVQGLMDLNV